jgi:hypothetical protein
MLSDSKVVIRRLLSESTDISSLLKEVVASNRFALRNLISLYNAFRGDDPQLQSKDSKMAMQAILSAISKKDAERASYFGQMTWEPDALKFAEFLSSVGDDTLAQHLGISSPDEIPTPDASDIEGAELDGEELDIGNDEPELDAELDPPEEESDVIEPPDA